MNNEISIQMKEFFEQIVLNTVNRLCVSHNIELDRLVNETQILYFGKDLNESYSKPLAFNIPLKKSNYSTLVLEMKPRNDYCECLGSAYEKRPGVLLTEEMLDKFQKTGRVDESKNIIIKFRVTYSNHYLIPVSNFWIDPSINGNINSFYLEDIHPEPISKKTLRRDNPLIQREEVYFSKVVNNWYQQNKHEKKIHIKNLHDFLVYSNSN